MANEKIDLSLQDEIINLIKELQEIESHSIASWIGTRKGKYLKILNKSRELRTKWAELIFTEEENSQKWCDIKHILSASKRATEVATKYLSLNDEEKCKEALLDSGEIMGMYYYINEEEKEENKNGFFNKLMGGKK